MKCKSLRFVALASAVVLSVSGMSTTAYAANRVMESTETAAVASSSEQASDKAETSEAAEGKADSQKNAVKEETAVKETSEQKKDDAKNAETPKTEVKKADSLTASEGAVKISVNAQMPEGSELTVTKLTPDRFAYQNIEAVMQKKDAGFDIAAVYDIAVYNGASVWEPAENNSAQITLNGILKSLDISADELVVYHMDDSEGTNTKKVDVKISEDNVTMNVEHFSPFVFGSASASQTAQNIATSFSATNGNNANVNALLGTSLTPDVSTGLEKFDFDIDAGTKTLTISLKSENTTAQLSENLTTAFASKLDQFTKVKIVPGTGKTITLKGSVFANLKKVTSIELGSGVSIVDNATSMFGGCKELVTITSADAIVLPATIKQMFKGDAKLTVLPSNFTFTANTADATEAFYNSGLTTLDLTSVNTIATQTKMLYHMENLTTLKTKAALSADSEWTGRWYKGAADDDARLASSWIGSSATENSVFHRLTTTQAYVNAGLDSMYHISGLGTANAYRIADEGKNKEFAAYCVNWNLDIPGQMGFYAASTVSNGSSWSTYLDTVGARLSGLDSTRVVERNLSNYNSDVQNALNTILFFGYPNDGAGIQDSKGYSNAEFYNATQLAIWNVLSGVLPSEGFSLGGLNTSDETKTLAAAGEILSKTYTDYTAVNGTVVSNDLTAYIPDASTQQVMVSGKASVRINKIDLASNGLLSGATLALKDEAGNTVDTWTTDTNTHVVKGLELGKNYTLSETAAPSNYDVTDAITFKAEGSYQLVKMNDGYSKHKIIVNKVDDSTSASPVTGAVLELTGKDYLGKDVTLTMTTPSTGKVEFEVLPGTYTIKETKVPSGYSKAEDIVITVKADDVDASKHVYSMVDPLAKYGSVAIIKYGNDGKTPLPGAVLKVVDSKGTEVDKWESTTAIHTIDNLVVGEKYKLVEVSAPEGYEKIKDVEFTVENGKTKSMSLTDPYKKHKLIIKKVDEGNNRVAGAKLKVTGKVLNGNAIEEIIFETSSDADKELSLLPGTYSVEETVVPEGYEKATKQSVTIEVKDDETKTVTLVDKKIKEPEKTEKKTETPGTVTILKYETGTTTPVNGAVLAIYNGDTKVAEFTTTNNAYTISTLTKGTTYTLKEITVPAGYVKAQDIQFTADGSAQTIIMYDAKAMVMGAKAPKTGDQTPIGLLMMLMAISFISLVGIGIFYTRKKIS